MGLPKVHILVACDMAVLDASGKLTIYGVFDRIWAREFPVRHPQMAIVWQCLIDEDCLLETRFVGRDGKEFLPSPAPIHAVAAKGNLVRTIYALQSIEFADPGPYKVVVVCDGSQELSEYIIHLERLPQSVHAA